MTQAEQHIVTFSRSNIAVIESEWLSENAKLFNVKMPKEVPMTVQDRAYSVSRKIDLPVAEWIEGPNRAQCDDKIEIKCRIVV